MRPLTLLSTLLLTLLLGNAALAQTTKPGAEIQANSAAQDGTDDTSAATTSVDALPAPEVESLLPQAEALPHDLSPWGMYLAADWVVKGVMIGLLIASLLTWSVWIGKLIQLAQARKRANRLLQLLVESEHFAQARQQSAQQRGAGMDLLQATAHELVLSARGPASDEGIKERIGARLDRVQIHAGSQMNKGTGILATIGSIAPFVGLFGTVWGIMNSFIGIAQSQNTNLAVVAPGIAEALLATACGLVAAIPAVVIYNHFARAINGYRAQLGDIATALLTLVSRDLDRQQGNQNADAEDQHQPVPISMGRH
ncbi:tonB-system energizer ExbB [Pseudomonas neustonica]|uniref:Biopolymer transport protein ExbB n=1 Tax=Pseudomonas neustonica TaxID=2487346 RepID=A0ABX9XIW3_9PSED|nr:MULTISPECIES: tonB-system energizer ExbB [Pseudomonas]ROZ80769.1 tonB-system energizer ExbB [Pseudomonas sp. SSM44]ROZ82065.1 tonB-system energizer ExbB [Pseudomonas neustonica]|tara:strand:+ start:1448 stop:2383 length:936 start_codon:yes stop_codon:yes gene_type:complete